MKDLIKKYIKDFVKEYEKQESISTTWREPLVGFADVNSEEIKNIQEELNEQMQIRRDKLAEYEADGIYPFGQRFVVKDYAKDIKEDFLKTEEVCHEVTLEEVITGKFMGWFEAILRVIAPLL